MNSYVLSTHDFFHLQFCFALFFCSKYIIPFYFIHHLIFELEKFMFSVYKCDTWNLSDFFRFIKLTWDVYENGE